MHQLLLYIIYIMQQSLWCHIPKSNVSKIVNLNLWPFYNKHKSFISSLQIIHKASALKVLKSFFLIVRASSYSGFSMVDFITY